MLSGHAARATAAAAEGAAAGAVMLAVPEAVALLSGGPQWSVGRAFVDAAASMPEAVAVAVLLVAAAVLSLLYDRAAAAGDERGWDLLFGAGSGVLVVLAALSAALPDGATTPLAAGWMLAQGSYGASLVLLRRRGMSSASPAGRSDEPVWADDAGALLPGESLLPHD